MAEDSGLLAPTWAGTVGADLTDDGAWLRAMLAVEGALARAQARLGVIPAGAAETITDVTRGGGFDVRAVALEARGAANPVVGLVRALTAQVAAVDAEAAEYVHRGGTSQDILDTAAMLVARDVLADVETSLVRTARALARLAEEHRDTVMAGRTLTQHAVPVTFGLKAAGWLTLTHDALRRVRAVELPAELGGAAGTLASYLAYAGGSAAHGAELSAEFARELGLSEPVLPWHALRTPIADLGAVTAFVCGALGKFAIDVQGMSRTEVGEVAEPAADGRGISSAMPQKQNPVLATLLIAAARQVPAYASVLTGAMVAEDERAPGAWHAEWQPLRECLRLTAGAAATAAELAEGLRVFPDRLRENLAMTGGTIVAERLTVALAPHLGRAAAKKVLARVALQTGLPFDEALARAPELADLDPAELRALLDPAAYTGCAGPLVDRALAHHRSILR